MGSLLCFLFVVILPLCFCVDASCSNGNCKLNDECSSNGDCGAGLYCFSCPLGFLGSRCVRSSVTDQFKHINNSLPFNKYAFLTTHNAFAIDGEPSHTGVLRTTITNQEDSVTQQLKNGVRGLMLDTYDFDGDVWLCHSFQGQCYDFTAFKPAIDTLKEIASFLSANPTEIVTLILEDYVKTPKGLTKVFTEAGLMKFWFPVSRMPKSGGDWPLVSDMVAKNQRLLVFTSVRSKEQSEGIAYQWNYMVENQYGDGGMKKGNCPHRAESSPLDDKSKSLVLVNYFRSTPFKPVTCVDNSGGLIDMLQTCHGAAGNRWANYVAVDYYKRSEGRFKPWTLSTRSSCEAVMMMFMHVCLDLLHKLAQHRKHSTKLLKMFTVFLTVYSTLPASDIIIEILYYAAAFTGICLIHNYKCNDLVTGICLTM